MIRNICLDTWVRYYTGHEKKNNSVKKIPLLKKSQCIKNHETLHFENHLFTTNYYYLLNKTHAL